MANIFGILHTGVSGLYVAQSGIDVTGHNIANLNTEGYSRQRVIITTESPLNVHPGPFGRGAKLDAVVRTYDDVLAKTLRNETSSFNYWDNLKTSMDNIKIYFNELESGSGLGDDLKEYFNAWSDLSNTAPDNSDESYVKRRTLIEKATTLTMKIRESYNNLEGIRRQNDQNIKNKIEKINDLAKNIAFLNYQIAKSESGGDIANDLRDKRDKLLDDLSKEVNFVSSEQSNGQISVFIGGIAIVDSSESNKLYAVENPKNNDHFDIYWGSGGIDKPQVNITDKIIGGSIYGEIKTRDSYIGKYTAQLNELASTLIVSTNQLHSIGQGLKRFDQISSNNGVINPSYKFNEDSGKFNYPINKGTFRIALYNSNNQVENYYDIDVDPEKDSLNSIILKISSADADPSGGKIQAFLSENNTIKITVAEGYTFTFKEDTSNFLVASGLNSFFKGTSAKDIDLSSLVKDDSGFIATSLTGEPGDNQNALNISNIKYKPLSNNVTIDEFYTTFVSLIGSDKAQVDTFYDTKKNVVQELKLKLDQIQGVSMDEEYTNLIKFQKAYEANARFITAVDQMIDKLINGTGLAGR
ncbi:MAG: flagellar hook-associated protein FlgK [Calditerrivibrio sp.]|uniref:flagellar hook-associated protein FlgK n=1 Tax=Calditerrivibrio sp. TaxID=2792612 RepID=UPI003D13F47E